MENKCPTTTDDLVSAKNESGISMANRNESESLLRSEEEKNTGKCWSSPSRKERKSGPLVGSVKEIGTEEMNLP